ncbi:phospholipid-translocating P-type ATPase [Rhizophagus irregularis]|uniref:Phospholipid-transporting ATPase n=1 Tax=Rhizophagus irregularis TaxID=588596 RepID=A0A2I1G742_9GLOM|nr:phospholipid-translocating P-type ATPase [Rhizophagus irregularis]
MYTIKSSFNANRVKQRSSDLEDEAPLIQNQHDDWVESSPASPVSPRRRRNIRSSASTTNVPSRNTTKAKSRTISFKVAEKLKDKYPANVVRNQKYNLITFFPLVFYQQFHIFINLYFLLVALSQFIPPLKIGYIITYLGPLCFVILVTMGKEAYDDWKRYKRDQENNSQKYQIMTTKGIKLVPSSKIRVGDLIIINKDQRIPADLILLRTTESSGACFIRTDQLDGETDWKLRLAVPYCQKLPSDESLLDINAEIYADSPQKDIHNFVGNFSKAVAEDIVPQVEALNVENTLWMNTVLASGTAIGFVIYTGKDTRAVMNTSHPETKVGLLDQEINRLSKILFLVTLLLSLLLIALNGFRGLWYIYLFRFLILFSSIIPIGLRVNLDMGKTVYGYQIMNDREIPDTIVRTSTIPEELGRIEYLLSDKTGTLTKNDMELKKLHMGTMAYNIDTMDEISNQLDAAFGKQQGKDVQRTSRTATSTILVGKSRRDMSSRIKDIVFALALCHNVTPVIESDDSEVTYQASSPDEVAIVKWTEHVGLTLVFRDINEMHLRTKHGDTFEFQILQIFPFTSETKRMGIIVKDKATDEIYFYEKGADVVMSRIVQYNDWLDEECGNMAREGLRTLVVARKKLSEEVYNDFSQRYHEAKVSLSDRKAQEQAIISTILENELELLGVTGVEDKLQDGVKTTLELLRNAGLKIWMLTGDKIETATCIAISSKLISRNQTIHQISKRMYYKMHLIKVQSIEDAHEELISLQTKGDICLVIDGESLQIYMDHYQYEFIELAVELPVVVACRCSPTQKADITKLIKKFSNKRVCCIGDGGNDVSMIQAADVGVGIVGKEGKQASLAADFSVTQFSFLTKLLLWHGRNSYKRSAKLAQFVIHRILIISVIQAVFSAIFYFAPIALYQGILIVGYSTVYTMAPVFSLVLDKDVRDDIALQFPELYKDLIKGRSLSLKTFFQWLMISVYQGGAIMIMSIVLFEDEFINIVSISFTALILNELLMVALEINTWHRLMVLSEIITLAIYIVSMIFLPTYFDLTFILTETFVWKVLVITAISSLPLYIVKFLRRRYSPPSYLKLT